jgi:hypothetical protein
MVRDQRRPRGKEWAAKKVERAIRGSKSRKAFTG